MANLSTKTGLPSFSQQDQAIINYFTDGGFERGVSGQVPAGWSQYDDGTTAAIPVDGTGGSAVSQVTMLVSNSSPIRGVNSVVITKDDNNRRGVGFSFPFTISPVDRGITAGVDFELITSAAYQTGDLVFYIYDVTNSILVTPTLQALPKADNYGKFFSNYGLTTGTQYRFILHIATTNTSAWTVKLDTMTNTTSKSTSQAPIVNGEVNFIPSTFNGFGSVSTYEASYFQRGPLMKVYARIVPNPSSAAEARFGLQSGLTIGLIAGASLTKVVGNWWTNTSAGTTRKRGDIIAVPGDSYVKFASDDYTTASAPATALNGNVVEPGSNSVILEFEVPIAQWGNASQVNAIQQNTQSPIRAGTIQAFAGATTPAGWLDCDGSAKLIADYPQLYAQIGTTWNTCTNPLTGVANSAPAAGNFRVPDLRGAFMRGVGTFSDSIGTNTSLAGYQGDQMQGHYHAQSLSRSSTAGATSEVASGGASGGNATFANVSPSTDGSNGTPRTGTETRPRNVGVKYIIKAWDESFNLAGFAVASGGNAGMISYYQEDDTTLGACTFQGNLGGAASPPIAIKVTRIGRVVTIDIPSTTSVIPTSNSIYLGSNTNLPIWARPPLQRTMSSFSHNNGTWNNSPSGMVLVTTGGQIQFYRDLLGTAYANSANAGWYWTTITYNV